MFGVQEPTYINSTDGVAVALHRFGGHGPVVVISHANGFNGLAYRPFAERLAETFEVYALDYRGHGFTNRPNHGSQDWGGMGDDLLAVIDHLGGGPVHVIGHSMGGAAAVLAVDREPRSIGALWAFEPILVPPPEVYVPTDKSMLAEGAGRRRAEFDSYEAAIERYRAKPPLNTLDPRALRAYVEGGFEPVDGGVRLRCLPETEAATFEAAGASGAFEGAGRLSIPFVAALSGDGQPPSIMGRVAADTYPEVITVVDYPELNHFGPLQAPEAMAVDAGAWLAAQASPRAGNP